MTPQRKKPLARSGKPLRRSPLKSSRKRIRSRRADPKKRAWAKHRVKEFTDWLKTLPCCVTGKRTGEWIATPREEDPYRQVWVDPAHIKTRATGGDDLNNTLPLSREAHETQHRIGWPAFEKRYGIDAKALAKQYTEQWLATPDGEAWAHQEEP